MLSYLRSLVALNGTGRGRVSIEGKLFKVPAFTPDQKKVNMQNLSKDMFKFFFILWLDSQLFNVHCALNCCSLSRVQCESTVQCQVVHPVNIAKSCPAEPAPSPWAANCQIC